MSIKYNTVSISLWGFSNTVVHINKQLKFLQLFRASQITVNIQTLAFFHYPVWVESIEA